MWRRRFENYRADLRWFIYKHDRTITAVLLGVFVASMLLMTAGTR